MSDDTPPAGTTLPPSQETGVGPKLRKPLAAGIPDPVLILASRESGGSLLSSLIGAHPEFLPFPAANLLAFEEVWQLMRYGLIPRDSNLHGLLRFIANLLTGEDSLTAVQLALRWLMRREKAATTEVYHELCCLAAPRRLVDYSPLVSLDRAAMARALEAAPRAFVIHLTRHPFAQAEALRPAVWTSVTLSLDFWDRRGTFQPPMDIYEIGEQYIDWSVTPAVFDPLFSWYRTQKAAVELLAGRKNRRWMHLRLEELSVNPAECLQKVFKALGHLAPLSGIEAILQAGAPAAYACPGPYIAPFGTDYGLIARAPQRALKEAREAPLSRRKRGKKAAELPWRGDGGGFLDPVAALARDLGYAIVS